MIQLHRLGHREGRFLLNPDLVLTVEAHPDTTIALTTGIRLVVEETVEEVLAGVRAWRVGVLADALARGNPSSAFARR